METSLTSAWDERLRNAIRDSSEGGAQDPATVAQGIRQLVENPETPGKGENHSFE